MNNGTFTRALEVGKAGQRLSEEEALALAEANTPTEIHHLGEAALLNRKRRFGERATYVYNLSINPSNICNGGCLFCRYSALPDDDHAYVLEENTIFDQIATTNPSEVHIVGGMNRIWGFQRNLALISDIRERYPLMHIKAYTAVELDWFSRFEDLTIEEVLISLKEAGLNALPGGGAEIFSARMRSKYCPSKLSPEGWIAIHHLAHKMDISTNATMLYGLGETPTERVEHLLALREAQDKTGGFSCFIPLAYQPGEERMSEDRVSPIVDLSVVALARLILDNVPHIKAYWPMIGLDTTAVALSWGADDLDGTLGHERIAHTAGARTPRSVTQEQMEETIRLGGFEPAERDGRFRLVSNC